jgi:hypothetical protein
MLDDSLSAAGALARTCEGCEACCTVMAVRELEKATWTPCRHLAGQGRGCAVWGEHPSSCKTFHCLWRGDTALLPERLFPPDCGFLISVGNLDHWPLVVQVCALPGRRHAWNTPENRAVFGDLARAWNCVVTITGEGVLATHAFAPNGRVYSRTLHPEIFPADGAVVAVPAADYGPDRRAPRRRLGELRATNPA